MKRKIVKLEANPQVIAWAIKTSGWKNEELAKSLKTSENTLKKWLSGESKPTINQLKALSNKTKRPLAAFFLNEVPKERPLPKDYRLLPDREGIFDKKTVFAIRRARRVQSWSAELSGNINDSLKPRIKKYSLVDSPESAAEYYRNLFELSLDKYKSFKSDYDLYHLLRGRLEDLNVLPLQISMPLEDARGFALVDKLPRTIVVNSQDEIRPRIFSLMHEFGHVLLGESVVDFPNPFATSQNDVERWCNSFASQILVPDAEANKLFSTIGEDILSSENLKKLSNKFRTSKAVILYKMKSLGRINQSDLDSVLSRYYSISKPKKSSTKEKKSSAVPVENRILAEVGNKFVSLVSKNYDREFITYSDALSYLNVKVKNFEKVLTKAKK